MVIQTEVYPGYGYQQQGWYSTNDYHSTPPLGMPVMTNPGATTPPLGMPVMTNPGATTPQYAIHHMVAGGGYPQQLDDSYGKNKPPNGMHNSHGSQGQMLPSNYNDGYPSSGGKHSNTTGNTGYTTSCAQHVPMGTYPIYVQHVPMGKEAMIYEYSSLANERERSPSYSQNGYPKAEWILKGVDD